jgi:hypothetical protein
MPSFYIASSLENVENVKRLRDELVSRGWTHTYDWSTHGSVQDDPSRWRAVARAEVDGVIQADTVIVLMPGGRGTHVELGIALGIRAYVEWDNGCLTPAIHLIGDDPNPRTCVFYHHPAVVRHATVEAFLEAVTGEPYTSGW